jgi:hypothetical protein
MKLLCFTIIGKFKISFCLVDNLKGQEHINLDQLHCARKDDGTLAWNIERVPARQLEARLQTKKNAFKVPFPNLNRSTRNCRRMGSHRGGTIFGGTIP